MTTLVEITRRDFLRHTGVGTSALVLGFTVSPNLFAAGKLIDAVTNGVALAPFVAIKPLSGDIVIITHRAEMGQGIRSSLAAVIADEMDADWKRVTLRQSDADSVTFAVAYPYQPADQPKYIVDGNLAQFTDSSRSMAAYFGPMRLFGAAIRLVMMRAAARKWKMPDTSQLETREHKVWVKGTKRNVDYGKLLLHARAVAKTPPDYEEIVAALKPIDKCTFINKEKIPFVDAPDMVTGRTKYGADIRLRGMLTAVIERSPVANGDVESFDDSETRKVDGVVDVIPVRLPGPLGLGGVGGAFAPHSGVAVLAKNTWAAMQGRKKLKVKWTQSPHDGYETEAYRRELEASAAAPGEKVRVRGDVDRAFAGAATIVEAQYYVPHLAQAPMEPPVATALFENGKLEVWAPSQNPDSAQQMAGVAAFGIPPEQWELPSTIEEMRRKVTVHLPLLGGGFGRKSKPDYIVEAAILAAKKPGTPIRVQWTREDDVRFSYFNAVSSQYLKAGLDGSGRATAILQRSAAPSIFATLFPPPADPEHPTPAEQFFIQKRADFHDGGKYPYSSATERAQGLEDMPFDLPNLQLESCAAKNHIRIGWMRSVANVYHAFAIGSFVDEMARAAGNQDPVNYLLELIGKGSVLDEKTFHKEGVAHFNNNEFPLNPGVVTNPRGESIIVVKPYEPDSRRLRNVIERAAASAQWKDRHGRLPKGRGLGIAAHRSFLTYVAMVFDVSLNESNELTINEVHASIDCGLAVNPDRVRAQIEGGINYGLSMALLGEITVRDGQVQQRNFDNYPVLRITQIPKKIIIDIVESDRDPTGVGEPPTPVVAPALANAIVAAGGPRIREMPFHRHIKVVA
ncbi:MAG TPA: molybdopterin cofactor-binding domain-containing protein [Thermoanaerobaculia bacterium]|nr:molybdopterin cofactor-binding domain-containing protein [Thermoanaerobaculia bacterium]